MDSKAVEAARLANKEKTSEIKLKEKVYTPFS